MPAAIGPILSDKAAAGVKRRISAAIGFPYFEAFTPALDEARKRARAAFAAIIGRLTRLASVADSATVKKIQRWRAWRFDISDTVRIWRCRRSPRKA
jgi:hypothetical protein